MELKTFQARSMSEVLAKVKRDLGRGAVILNTRTIKRGGVLGVGARSWIEITATADPRVGAARSIPRSRSSSAEVPRPSGRTAVPEKPRSLALSRDLDGTTSHDSAIPHGAVTPRESQTPRGMPTGAATMTPGVQSVETDETLRGEVRAIAAMVRDLLRAGGRPAPADLPSEMIEFYVRLVSQEVADDIVREIVARARETRANADHGGVAGSTPATSAPSEEELRAHLVRCISEMLPPAESLRLVQEKRPTVVALVGPTGVGKTTTLAKLAAHVKLRENRRVGLITLDTYRIAAVEQLRTYAQILQVPLVSVTTPAEVRRAIRSLSHVELILIDTAGRSQRDEPRIAELAKALAAARPDQVHLVLSSTSREGQVRQAVETFASVGADHVIFTKLDEAVGFGVILNVLRNANLRLSYLTNGQSVPDDFEVGSTRRVAELILSADRMSTVEPAPLKSSRRTTVSGRGRPGYKTASAAAPTSEAPSRSR